MIHFRLSTFLLFTTVISVFIVLNLSTYKEADSLASTMTQILPPSPIPGYGWPWQCVDVGMGVLHEGIQQNEPSDVPIHFVELKSTYYIQLWPLIGNTFVLFLLLLITYSLTKPIVQRSEQRVADEALDQSF